MKLLSSSGNAKIVKNRKHGFLPAWLSLAPATQSGFNVCPASTRDCRAGCVAYTGNGNRDSGIKDPIYRSRIRKTQWLMDDTDTFMEQLIEDIRSHAARAHYQGLRPIFRLNTFSDIAWENTELNPVMDEYQFYDYTKRLGRITGPATEGMPSYYDRIHLNKGPWPARYELTYSWRQDTFEEREAVENLLTEGINVAVPFFPCVPVGSSFLGGEVIDGDKTDLRLREFDGQGVIVGLRWKNPDTKGDRSILSSALKTGWCINSGDQPSASFRDLWDDAHYAIKWQ